MLTIRALLRITAAAAALTLSSGHETVVRNSLFRRLPNLWPPSLPGHSPRVAEQPAVHAERNILTFGDSLTAGFVRPRAPSYPPGKFLQDLLSAEDQSHPMCGAVVRAEGVVGESTASMAGRLEKLLTQQGTPPPDVVVLLGGTNDLWRCDEDFIMKNLEACYDVVARRSPQAVLGMVSLPKFAPDVLALVSNFQPNFSDRLEATREAVNERLEKAVKDRSPNAFMVSLDECCPVDDEVSSCGDGIHFSKAGYRLFGGAIHQSLTLHYLTATNEQ